MTVSLDAFDDEYEDELTPAQLAALDAMDGGFDPADLDPDELDADPPEEWLALSPRERVARPPAPGPVVPEVFDAGFTHRDGGDGRGFAAGGELDQMAPGGVLAMVTDRVWANGLSRLSDNELIGLMAAQRRLASRAAAGELAAIGELSVRRAGPDGRPGEHVEEEVAAALTLTGRAAASQVGLAAELARLRGVARALAAGRIDLDKAEVFTGQLMLLDVIAANAIAGIILPKAPGMTTGRLRKALADQIMDYDPQALVRRRKEAEKDARVETWTESAGTGAVAGRDLPPADVLAADQRLTADARWLKRHGIEGSMDQLRAKAFTARLTGQSLDSLLPVPAAPDGPAAGPAADGPGAADGGAARPETGNPAPRAPRPPAARRRRGGQRDWAGR